MRSEPISVVLVAWDNYVRFLPECLDTIAAQTDCAIESIIVVDNASSVALPALDAGFEIVPTEERISLGAARNLGLSRVTTPLVCFFDVDDCLMPGTFGFLARRMSERRDLASCACSLLRWYPSLDLTFPHWWPDRVAFSLVGNTSLFAIRNMFIHQFPMACAALHRTALCLDAGGFSDLEYGEDWALANGLLCRGPVELHRRPGRLYRAHVRTLGFPIDAAPVTAACRAIRARASNDPRSPQALRRFLPAARLYHDHLLVNKILRDNRREAADIRARLSDSHEEARF